jgi:type VI secretion system FHA domain protein
MAAKAAVQPAAAVGDGVEGGLAAFCRGAGIDPMSIAPKARGAALQLAGQMLRESVSGLFDLTHSRAEFHARFSIEVPGEALDSPVNFSQGVDEALVSLLSNLSSVSGSPEAIRENFRELNAQNTASLAAMRVAFEAFLDRVDPEELLQRFESAAKRGVFGSPSKSRCWDLYTELFQGLAQRPAGGFPKLFADSFTTAYEAKMRTLIPPRRSSVGADRHESITTDEAAKGDP